jgi:alpha-1,3-rhamnosyl/mannosyltransferase
MKKKKINVFVDAEVLILSHFSGIGHYTASLLKAVDELLNLDEYSHLKVTLGVPIRDTHKLARYEFANFSVRKILLTPRLATGLKQKGLLPPIDLLFGKNIYVFPNYSSWPTLFSKSLPIIYDLSFIKFSQFGDTRNMEFLVDQVGKSVKRSERVITISTNSKSEISSQYRLPKNKIDIVYPIIEMRDFYRRSQKEIAEVKAQYGVFGDYILFVGNLEPRKNLTTLLDAYEKLPKKLQDKYSLLLVGAKGWKNDGIHTKIRDMRMKGLRVIQPIDYVVDQDVPALVSGASAFAYVSVYEGFGIPPVEALACGTPVIASNNSSLPEACGDAVLYVDALNVNDIAKKIEQALNGKHPAQESGYTQAMKYNATAAAKEFVKSIEEASK